MSSHLSNPALAFEGWMRAIQQEFEATLSTLLPPASALPQRLHAAMRYAVLDGGKRVRPLLVFAAGGLFDGLEPVGRRLDHVVLAWRANHSRTRQIINKESQREQREEREQSRKRKKRG